MEKDLIPDYNNKRGEKNPPHKKTFCFKTCHKNTMNSLHEVEYFLNNLHDLSRYLHLYKFLK